MDGGMICTCDERTLDQLGATRDNFVNFICHRCGKFVHLHYTEEVEHDLSRMCAKCEYEAQYRYAYDAFGNSAPEAEEHEPEDMGFGERFYQD